MEGRAWGGSKAERMTYGGLSKVFSPEGDDNSGGQGEHADGHHKGSHHPVIIRSPVGNDAGDDGHKAISKGGPGEGVGEEALIKTFGIMLTHHPGIRHREQQGSGNSRQQSSKQQHIKVRGKLGKTRKGVDDAKDHSRLLPTPKKKEEEKTVSNEVVMMAESRAGQGRVG